MLALGLLIAWAVVLGAWSWFLYEREQKLRSERARMTEWVNNFEVVVKDLRQEVSELENILNERTAPRPREMN